MRSFNGTSNETFLVSGHGVKWKFGSSALIQSDSYGIHGEQESPRLKIEFMGTVYGEDVGIYVTGNYTRVDIGASGQVTGDFGVYVGEHGKVVNRGSVIGNDMAIATEYDHVTTINHGDVVGPSGIFGGGDGAKIVNGKQGRILASETGVSHESDTRSHFANHGLVDSLDVAYDGHDGEDAIVNRGRMIGDIVMDDGNDVLDNRGGSIKGAIYGNKGNDILITDHAKDKLIENAGEGLDTVKSSVTYKLSDNVERLVLIGTKNIDGKGTVGGDHIEGNAGNNVLIGLQGADTLDGGRGNDILKGGAEGDRFVFSTGYDKDIIALFQPGVDDVDVRRWKAIDDFADLRNHASNHGADVWVKAGDDILVIRNTHKADLDAGDFLF